MALQKAAANTPQDATGINLVPDLPEGAPVRAAAACQDAHELATPSGKYTSLKMSVHLVCCANAVLQFQVECCRLSVGLVTPAA